MITIIIPAYNEARTIEKCINEVRKKLQEMKINYQIIIAEDGSSDNTYQIAKSLAKKYKNIEISHFDKRLGRGSALKRCVNIVKGDFVIYMDADLSTKLDALELLIRELKYNDIVIGSRYIGGAKYKRSLIRLMLSRAYNLIRLLLFPKLKVKDCQCGFKGFRKDIFIEINKNVEDGQWFWDTEFLIKANARKAKIKEIPIEWGGDKRTSVKILKDSIIMFAKLIKLRLGI
ncbi:MAG: glycosyltransferase [Candidatus Aenigmatarchaeota archaeon]